MFNFSVPNNVNKQLLFNTFCLLGLSLLTATCGVFLTIFTKFSFLFPVLKSMITSKVALIALVIFIFLLPFLLYFLIYKFKNSPLGVLFLLLFTFIDGIFLSFLISSALKLTYGLTLIGLSILGTALTFIVMAIIGATTKKDLSTLGSTLTFSLLFLILFSIANIFLHIPLLSLAISFFSCLIFAGYMMYDINKIINNGETNYIIATLNLYLDIIIFFQNLLKILMFFSKK